MCFVIPCFGANQTEVLNETTEINLTEGVNQSEALPDNVESIQTDVPNGSSIIEASDEVDTNSTIPNPLLYEENQQIFDNSSDLSSGTSREVIVIILEPHFIGNHHGCKEMGNNTTAWGNEGNWGRDNNLTPPVNCRFGKKFNITEFPEQNLTNITENA